MNTLRNIFSFIFIIILLFLVSCQQADDLTTKESGQEITAPTHTVKPVTPSGWTSFSGAKNINDMAFDDNGNLWSVGVLGVYQLDLVNKIRKLLR